MNNEIVIYKSVKQKNSDKIPEFFSNMEVAQLYIKISQALRNNTKHKRLYGKPQIAVFFKRKIFP
jgi:hypothetical protein